MNYKSWLGGGCRLFILVTLGTLGAIAPAFAQTSQIVPDSTLGNRNSVVIPNVGGLPLELVVGGDQRGGNLFHSFSEFNVSGGRAAYFDQPQGVINILSRVTGKNPSQILGTLGVLGSANLFFINPNGIIFGPNASLDVGGAFVASTANAIRLGDKGLFSASDPASSNLLSIQPSALFFNALQPKPIINQSIATSNVFGQSLNGDPDRTISGLQVLNGQPLLLVGGPISMPGGVLSALDGRVELAAISGQGNVGLIGQGQTLRLSLPVDLARADISFSQQANANVMGQGAGSIAVYANNFTLTQGSGLAAGIDLNGSPVSGLGEIRVSATNNLTLEGGSGIVSSVSDQTKSLSTTGTKAASIFIDAGAIKIANSFIGSFTESQGNAGDVTIQAKDAIVLDGGTILSAVIESGIGNGGNIFVKGRSLTLDGGNGITAGTLGQGNAGSIRAEIAGDITVKNRALIEANTSAQGDAGSITLLSGGNVVLDQSGFISNVINSSATGDGNDITIQARSLSVTGGSIIAASTVGKGDAGDIKIKTSDNVFLARSGQIQSLTNGIGNSGAITINAGGQIQLDGAAGNGNKTGISTQIASAGVGNAKNISLNAGSLILSNGAEIVASSLGVGNAGDISAKVFGDVTLSNGSVIESVIGKQGNAGSINLLADGNISLSGSSAIGNAIFTSAVGNGNGITIKARSLKLEGSLVIATTLPLAQGNAGNIKIDVLDGISLTDGGQIQSFSDGKGNAGRIDLTAGGNILIDGPDADSTTGIGNALFFSAVGEGSDITIKARSLSLNGSAVITASTVGQGNAGNIKIEVLDNISLSGGGQIQSATLGNGNPGRIDLIAGGNIFLEGTGTYDGTTAITNAIAGSAIGEGNDITIQAKSLTVTNSAIVAASTIGQGNAGNVEIDVSGDVFLSGGGQIQSITGGKGDAGRLNISAGGDILLDGTGTDQATAIGNIITESGIGEGKDINLDARSLTVIGSSAFVGASTLGQGSAGNIMINVLDRISLLSGGQIQSFTSGNGNAGKIDLNAGGNILLQGTGIFGTAGVRNSISSSAVGEGNDITIKAQSLTLTDAAAVNASTFGQGNAGNISINVAENVSAIRGGEILSLTRGNGDAGSIAINAGGQIQLEGVAADGTSSVISTEIGSAAVGASQGIRLQAQALNIGSGGLVATSTTGRGNAGNINVSVVDGISVTGGGQLQAGTFGQGDAGSITLNAGGRISIDGQDAEGSPSLITNLVSGTSSGKGADILIQAESLSLSNGSLLATTTIGQGDAGNLDIRTTNGISIAGNSGILTATDGQGDGGAIRLVAGTSVFLGGESQLTTGTRGQGNAGNINVRTTDGIFVTGGSLIQATTIGYGNGGNINLQAGGQVALDGNSSQITSAVSPNTDPLAQGNGGNINLQAQTLALSNGGLISANTASNGDAGNINLSIQNAVNLSGDSSIDSSTAGIGNGGIIDLTTRSLALTSGGQISAAVVRGQDGALGGQGRGGTIRVNADRVNISGFGSAGSPSGLFTLTQAGTAGPAGDIFIIASNFEISNAGVVAAGTNNIAQGGNITINANQFSALGGGQIITASQSSGNAGTIQLNVTGAAVLAGQEANFQQRIAQLQQSQNLTDVQQQQDLGSSDRQGISGLFAGTSPNSTGNSGNVQVNANQLTLSDGATITVDSRGAGNGGNLNIQTGNLLLENGASLNAATASGEGGNIALNVGNLLQMRQNSLISAQAQGTGNGGNLDLNTRFLFATGNSDIVANAFAGRGGNIQITAQGIFGIQVRDSLTSESDINASSQFGADGVVELNTTIDPSSGLEVLPFLVVDVSGLIAQGCRAEETTASRFVMTGRGGLPTNPSDLLSNEPILNDLGQALASSPPTDAPVQKSQAEPPQPIVEAQGWVVRPDGKIVLTAQAGGEQPTWFKTRSCQAQ
jgi:filamentous hemagglutinin family protein